MKRSRIRLAVLLCGFWGPATLLTAGEPPGNLLVNGDFEAKQPAWNLHTEKDAKATFTVEQDNGNAMGHAQRQARFDEAARKLAAEVAAILGDASP